MTEPLRFTIDVACSAAHAFAGWTDGLGTGWPADHTVTGGPDLRVVLEGKVGGRIYERTPSGLDHDWGEIIAWEPPRLLAYSWFLRADRADATDVTVRFVAAGPGATRVDARGRADRVAGRGEEWRGRNQAGWTTLFPHYLAAVTPS